VSVGVARPTFQRVDRPGTAHSTGARPSGSGRRRLERFSTIEFGLSPSQTHAYINDRNVFPVSDSRFVTFGPIEFQGARDLYRFAAEGDIPVGRPIGGTLWEINDPGGVSILGHVQVSTDLSLQTFNSAHSGVGTMFVQQVGDNTWAMFINQTSFTRLGHVFTFVYDPDSDVLTQTGTIDIAPGWGTNHSEGSLTHGGWNNDRAVVIVEYSTTPFGENGERIRFIDCNLAADSYSAHDFMVLEELGQEVTRITSVAREDAIYSLAWLDTELSVLRFDINTFEYLGKTVLTTLDVGGGSWSPGMEFNNDPNHGVLPTQDPQGGIFRGALIGDNGVVALAFAGLMPYRYAMRTHRPGEIIDHKHLPPEWNIQPGEEEIIDDVYTFYTLPLVVLDADTGEELESIIWQTEVNQQYSNVPPTRLTDTLFFTMGADFLDDPPENDVLSWTGMRWVHLSRLIEGGAGARASSTHVASDRTVVRRVP